MNKKEAKAKVRELLDAGTARSEVFAQLSGQGVPDNRIAYFIASFTDPVRREEHGWKVNVLVTIMLVQALLLFAAGFAKGSGIGPHGRWIAGIVSMLIPLLLAWGFYTCRAAAYNISIVFSIIQLPKLLLGIASNPVAASLALAINIAFLVYVWHVRNGLFPDFAFLAPRRLNGRYVFSD